MSNVATFLDNDEYKEYQELDGGVRRSVIEIPAKPIESDTKQKDKLAPHVLAPDIVKQVGELIAKHERQSSSNESKWFGCACIEVKEDDGMTWSAETVSLELNKSYPRFNYLYLTSYKDNYSLPAISNLIGVRSFLRLAGEHKLGTLFVLSKRWMAPAIVGAAVLIGAVIKLLETFQKASPTKTTYLIILASTALGLISKYIINHLTARTTPKKIENFNTELEKILKREEPSENYDKFIDSLAYRLQSIEFPRFVIIDDYERLDLTTKRVIRRYFKENVKHSAGSEYWVIFEGQDGEKFSTEITDGQKFYGYKHSRIFQQLFLNEEEKRRLVELLDRPQEALNYQAVKLICKDSSKGKERIKKIVEEHRKENPKDSSYGNLEFLYLLSLTAAIPSNFFLEYQDLIASLTASNAVRSDVLRKFLHGTRLTMYEFRKQLDGLDKNFSSTLITEQTKSQKKLHVNLETTLALTETARILDLPRPEMGHLFWSLYWYDKLQRPPEAFWIRKLNYHLRQAEPVNAQETETDKRILSQLFNALIYATDGSLRTGVFEDIPHLLEKALYLLEIGGLTSSYSHQKRLSKQCWEAYSVLGHDEILGVIFDLYAMPGRQAQVKATEEKEDLLEKLFFESMLLPPARRATLTTDFFRWTGGERQTVESVSHYARARSAWFALSISPIVMGLNSTELHQAVRQSSEILGDLTQKALDRIGSESEESIRITDIATLSLALWCHALRFSPAVRAITPSNHLTSFKALVDFATDAVLKASYIKKEATVRSENFLRMDFLASGLAGELYAIALASIITANRYLVRQGQEVIDQPLLEKIDNLLKFSEEIFNYPLPATLTRQYLTSSQLVEKIDAMLKFCGIIWDRFGLHPLLEFINIRRVHFNAICLGVNYAREEAYESLLESVGSAINAQGFTGLIANLVVADCLRQAGEIEAYYLRQAGSIAIEGNLGPQLQHELSFAVVHEIHNLEYDLDIFLQDVLEENGHHENFLLQLLKRLPQESLTGTVLGLFNAPHPSSPPELTGKLEKTVASFINYIQWPEVKREVESLVQYFSTEEKIRRKEVLNSSEILEFWRDRKEFPVYAGILRLLIESDSPPADIWKKSLVILDHDPLQDDTTWYLFLALELAKRFLKSSESDRNDNMIPIRYLRVGVEKWKSRLAAETNLEIYQTLLRFDSETKPYYFSEMQKWEYIRLRRDQLERLPKLIEEGQFFLIFYDYVHTMLRWGLGTDLEPKTFFGFLNFTPEKSTEQLTKWKNRSSKVPPPLNGTVVSAEFIYLGHYLFSTPNDQNSIFHEARGAFNRAAYDAMSELLDLIMELEALPTSIKDLLQTYSKRFFYNPTTG